MPVHKHLIIRAEATKPPTDEKYLKRALYLANLGKGYVAPNPLVGSLVVCNDKIIGEGYHEKYGGNHAEKHIY